MLSTKQSARIVVLHYPVLNLSRDEFLLPSIHHSRHPDIDWFIKPMTQITNDGNFSSGKNMYNFNVCGRRIIYTIYN